MSVMGLFQVDIEILPANRRAPRIHRTVLAFLAPESAPSLLGAQTLESFGLGVDPLAKRLVPVNAFLASTGIRSPLTSAAVAGALA